MEELKQKPVSNQEIRVLFPGNPNLLEHEPVTDLLWAVPRMEERWGNPEVFPYQHANR